MLKLKKHIKKNKRLIRIISYLYNHLNYKNKIYKKGVSVSLGSSFLCGVRIVNYGVENSIVIEDDVRMKNCQIVIRGNCNKIIIRKHSFLNEVEFHMEDDFNEINIGSNTSLCGRSHLATIEGTKITIGDNCLFSSDLLFQTGDSHSILDAHGKRTNKSKDISIGNHVWIGTRVTCLKGVHIAEDSIVAATTTLCRQYNQRNVVIGGVPGEIIKTEVNWEATRITN